MLGLCAEHGYAAELEPCVGLCRATFSDAAPHRVLRETVSATRLAMELADARRRTRLHAAAGAGAAIRVRTLLQAGAAVNAAESGGHTAGAGVRGRPRDDAASASVAAAA